MSLKLDLLLEAIEELDRCEANGEIFEESSNAIKIHKCSVESDQLVSLIDRFDDRLVLNIGLNKPVAETINSYLKKI